jgi:hypothetical protein
VPQSLSATAAETNGSPPDAPDAAAEPRRLANRWARRNLTPEQIALADELTRRADLLWRDAAGELSSVEAMTLAAVQLWPFPDEETS